MRYRISFILFVGFGLVGVAQGQSNIDSTNKFGWGENVGGTNWRDADSTNAGVVVSGTFMGGFIWGRAIVRGTADSTKEHEPSGLMTRVRPVEGRLSILMSTVEGG